MLFRSEMPRRKGPLPASADHGTAAIYFLRGRIVDRACGVISAGIQRSIIAQSDAEMPRRKGPLPASADHGTAAIYFRKRILATWLLTLLLDALAALTTTIAALIRTPTDSGKY